MRIKVNICGTENLAEQYAGSQIILHVRDRLLLLTYHSHTEHKLTTVTYKVLKTTQPP